jgi:hypothetical protein
MGHNNIQDAQDCVVMSASWKDQEVRTALPLKIISKMGIRQYEILFWLAIPTFLGLESGASAVEAIVNYFKQWRVFGQFERAGTTLANISAGWILTVICVMYPFLDYLLPFKRIH